MTSDVSLEARLEALASELDLPDADLSDAVLDQLVELPPAQRGGHRRLLIAAAIGVAIVIGTLAVAPAREAVASWLGIGSTSIRRVPGEELPEGGSPQLGAEVPLSPGGSPLPALGEPEKAFRDERGVTSYVWSATADLPELGRTGWGAILSVRDAGTAPGDMKLLALDDQVVAVDIGRVTGLWIPGEHIVTASGREPAIAHHVLLWMDGRQEYRLETELPLEEAVDLAASVEGTAGG